MINVKVIIALMILGFAGQAVAVSKPSQGAGKGQQLPNFVEPEVTLKASSFYRLKAIKRVVKSASLKQASKSKVSLSRGR